MQVFYSENESKQSGLQTGRGRIERLENIAPLRKLIIGQNLDLVKLKVNALNADVFAALNKLGFPYFVNSILYRNKKTYTGNTLTKLPAGFSYEQYSTGRRTIFKQMLEEIFDNTTGINYTHPLYRVLVSSATEKKMAVSYYLQFSSQSTSDKKIWLLKKGKVFIGFVCGQFLPAGFEGIWYGVLPAYRSKGFSSLLLDIIEIECRKRGVKSFYNDVQYQNIYSQQNVTKNGAIPESSYLNIFLLPCISVTQSNGLKAINKGQKTTQQLVAESMAVMKMTDVYHTSFWGNTKLKPTHTITYKVAKERLVVLSFYYNNELTAQQYIFS